MEITDSDIQYSANSVQKVEQDGDWLRINCFPHWHLTDLRQVKAIFSDLSIVSYSPRFLNHGNDLIIFSNEAHRRQWLSKQGFPPEWIATHLLPLELAEVFPFPTDKKTTEEERHVA